MDRNTHLVFNRRNFLASATALVAAGLLSRKVLALAGPQMFKQGAVDITILSDGTLSFPATMLAPAAPPEMITKMLADAGVTLADGNVTVAENITLIKDGAETILFDTGSGQGFQPTAGKILETMAAAGIDPGSITKIVFTHGHPDHLFGTTKDGKLNFPNASYMSASAEWDFWNDKELINKMPKEMHGFVLGAQANYGAIKDKVAMFKPGDAITANIMAIDTAGHTPGHVSFEVKGDGGLIIVGDVIPSPAVHFAHPEWAMGFDGNPELAVKSRQMLLDRAANEKIKLLGYHWPTPLGIAEKKDGAYKFVAAA